LRCAQINAAQELCVDRDDSRAHGAIATELSHDALKVNPFISICSGSAPSSGIDRSVF
jgi:hypothetical protein